jgi:translocation and assembly module TamB
MSRRARLLRNVAIGFAAFIVVLSVAVIVTVQTDWFREYVKRQIVVAAEQGTGGKVEIGSLAFDWKRLRAVVSGLVIHGKEPAGSAPWISVRRIELEFRIFSLSHLLNLSYLGVYRPEAAIMVFPDGSTNIPTPRHASAPSNTTPLETVVDLAVGRFELTDGTLTFNSRKQALNVRGDNLRAQLWYNVLERGYRGQISLEPLYVVSGRNRPVKFTLSLPIGLGRDRLDVRGATISTAASRIRIDAAVEDLRNPRTSAHISGRVALADLKNCSNLPLETNAGNLLSALDLDANAAITGEQIKLPLFI